MNENVIYNAKLIEVEDNLTQLKEIEIETKNREEMIEEIKQNTTQKIEANYKKFENTAFKEETAANIYREATKELENINQSLIREYQEYYILRQKFLELKEEKITGNTINKLVKETISLLNRILLATQSIENNKKFLNEIYKYAYDLMKYEFIYTSTSTLLEYAKTHQVHTTFIVKCIKEEVETLKNSMPIQKKCIEINKNGLDDIYFLDKELLVLVIKTNKKKYKCILEETMNNLFENYNTTKNILYELETAVSCRIAKVKESKKIKASLTRKQMLRKILFFLNLGFLGVTLSLIKKGSDSIAPIKHYATFISDYDSSQPNNEPQEPQYFEAMNNSLTITEYSPWESPGIFREEYKRNRYEYTINSDIEYSQNVEDYLTKKEYKDYITLSEVIPETSIEIPKESYTENKYVITQTYQDRNLYNEVENITLKLIVLLGLSAVTTIVDGICYTFYIKKRRPIKEEKQEVKKELETQKQFLIEEKRQITSLTEQLQEIKKQINEKYETLPKTLLEESDIQKRVRKLNE